MGDIAATSTRHQDDAVRAAAITALGHLPGSSEIALLLAGIAAGDKPEDARLARQSLSRLNGPGVAETVIAQATNGEQPIRVVFLEQLASRNVTSSVPLLLNTRHDPNAAIRSAALGSLAEIASPADQRHAPGSLRKRDSAAPALRPDRSDGRRSFLTAMRIRDCEYSQPAGAVTALSIG